MPFGIGPRDVPEACVRVRESTSPHATPSQTAQRCRALAARATEIPFMNGCSCDCARSERVAQERGLRGGSDEIAADAGDLLDRDAAAADGGGVRRAP